MGGTRPWMSSGIAASVACLTSACLLAPPRPGEADGGGGGGDGGAPDAATPLGPCAVQPATLDEVWTRSGDAFTRAEARSLSVWHQASGDLRFQLLAQVGGDGSGAGASVYGGPAGNIIGFERPQLLRDGSRLLVDILGNPNELLLDSGGMAGSAPDAIAVDPALSQGITLGGPSGGPTPRVIGTRRTLEVQDLIEIALVGGTWTRVRTIPMNQLEVASIGTASFDASGLRIVFVGKKAATDSGNQVLTSTRLSFEDTFSPATVLYGDATNTLADPWLDDACKYLYVSRYSTSSVVRLVVDP